MSFIFWMLIVSLGINLFMFVPAFIYKTDKLTDISYAITFIVVAVTGYIFSEQTFGHLIGLMLVVLWAIRLGSYLFVRISKMKKDPRFDDKRDYFFKFLAFWVLQGVTVFVVLVPSIMFLSQSETTLNWISWVGVLVFVSGLLIEAIADAQKSKFYSTKPTTWIDSGIWRMSRHPNYLGEIMVWVGVYLFVVPSLAFNQQLLALVGPAFIATMIIFVSGIPLLEKSSDKKWGDNKAYAKFKTEVPALIPSFSSIKRIFR